VQTLIRDILAAIGNWVKGELQITAILIALYTIGFALTKVPAWYLLGPLCGVLYLVPIIGGPVGLILTLAVSYFGDRAFGLLLATLGVWVFLQALEGFYLTPQILGIRTKLGPFAVFIGIIGASAVFGPIGVIFAVPVMSVLLVIWRFIDRPAPPLR
jgi:predicted PurR-regulated permease PerM